MQFIRGLQIMVGFFEFIHGCIQFDFSSEVSFLDNAQVIGTYPGSSKDELFGICASRCSNDIRCNAIDICSDNLKCKLIRGWTPLTPGSISEGVCQRFQMKCQDGYFFDRRNESCIQHYICDFESDPESTCFLSASPSSNIGWTMHSGQTGSTGTGPTTAYRGSNYKYIETTYGALGDKAILESSMAFQAKTHCLSMYYHMYGATINTLTIRTQKENNAAIDRWKLSGNQGDVWHHLSGVNLPLDSKTKIIIEATKGSSYTGDIAIDYVELWPFAYYCDFEDQADDDSDWIRNTGPTNTGSSGPTGPSAARFGSYYKYTDSAPMKRNDIVTLVSFKAFTARSYCLSFYYHIFGYNMGYLTVSTQNGTQSALTKWSTSGDHGDVWVQVPGIDFKLDPQTKILITARRYIGGACDIAVDLFELWPFPC